MVKPLFAASAAILLLAAACGDDGDDAATTEPTATPTATATVPVATGGTPAAGGATGGTPAAGGATGGTPAAGGSAGAGMTALSYATDIEPFFVMKCGGSTCHAGAGFGGPDTGPADGSILDFSQGAGYASLQTESLQSTMPFIGTTSADSYLWLKLTDAQSTAPAREGGAPPGLKMPFGDSLGAMEQSELDLVQQWIDGGALP